VSSLWVERTWFRFLSEVLLFTPLCPFTQIFRHPQFFLPLLANLLYDLFGEYIELGLSIISLNAPRPRSIYANKFSAYIVTPRSNDFARDEARLWIVTLFIQICFGEDR